MTQWAVCFVRVVVSAVDEYVPQIDSVGHILKIVTMIIQVVAILVPNFEIGRARAYPCSRYQAMYIITLIFATIYKANCVIKLVQNPTQSVAPYCISNISIHAHFITTFVTDNRSPPS
jgi:hypothetical protein